MLVTKYEGTAKELAEFFTATQTSADQSIEKNTPKVDDKENSQSDKKEVTRLEVESPSFFDRFEPIIPCAITV